MMTNKHDNKIIFVGDPHVGKTDIVKRFFTHSFNENYKETIGCDISSYSYTIDHETIELSFWDTTGQEKYRSLAPMYYRNSKVAVVVFDFSWLESFKSVPTWIEKINEICECNKIIIAGNKYDLKDKFQVSLEDANNFADRNGYDFLSVSAKTGENIFELLDSIAINCKGIKCENFVTTYLSEETDQPNNSRCC